MLTCRLGPLLASSTKQGARCRERLVTRRERLSMPHSQKESQLSGLRARMRRHWYSVFGSTLLALDHRHRNPHRPHFEDANYQLQKKNSWAKSHSKDAGAKSSAAGDDRLAATGTRTEDKEKFRKGRCHSCSVTFALTAFLLALGPRSCEHVIPICQRLTLLQDLWSAI